MPYSIGVYQLVHAPWTKRSSDGVHNSHAGVDVADQLRLALTGVRSVSQQDDLWLLHVCSPTLISACFLWGVGA